MALDFEAGNSEWLDMGLSLPALNGKTGVTLMCWMTIESQPAGGQSCIEVAIGPPPGTSDSSRARLALDLGKNPDMGGRAADGDSFLGVTSATTLSIGTLAHVVGTIDLPGDEVNIYIDGLLDTTASPGYGAVFSSTNSKNAALASADDGSTDFFDGILEDIRIYSRVLSAAEILTIFTARGTDGIVHGLEHRHVLNEAHVGVLASGAGSIKDLASRQLNITPNNSPVYAAGVLRNRRKVA